MVIDTAMRDGLNLAFLHLITTTAITGSATRRLKQHQVLTRYAQVGVFGESAHGKFHGPKADLSFVMSLFVCSLKEHIAFWAGICLSETRQEIMIRMGTSTL